MIYHNKKICVFYVFFFQKKDVTIAQTIKKNIKKKKGLNVWYQKKKII